MFRGLRSLQKGGGYERKGVTRSRQEETVGYLVLVGLE